MQNIILYDGLYSLVEYLGMHASRVSQGDVSHRDRVTGCD